jgi:hypothetical protein
VIHGYAVTNSYRVELEGHSSGMADAFFDSLGEFPEVYMAGDDFGKTVNDTHERALHFFGFYAHSAQQRAVWGSLDAFFYGFAFHRRLRKIKIPPLWGGSLPKPT